MRFPTPLVLALAAGCLTPAANDIAPSSADAAGDAIRVVQGAWWNATKDLATGYHTLDEIDAKVDAIAALDPQLVRIVEVGRSNGGHPLRALAIGEGDGKPVAWIDGGHHANEVEGVEASLHLAETLVSNYATNASIRSLVDAEEIWVLPLVNPDGHLVQTRYNANGVNLNRNYDVAWCQTGAYNTCLPGTGTVVASPVGATTGPPPEYAGPAPFSEPESAAVRDAIATLGARLALYVSHHTDVHCITAPWTAPMPPFEMPAEHRTAFDAVFSWVGANTVYSGGDWTWGTGECMAYSAGGTSMDWAYATHEVPSFTFEVSGCPARSGRGNFGGSCAAIPPLAEEVANALEVQLFLLANAATLAEWKTDFVAPPTAEASP